MELAELFADVAVEILVEVLTEVANREYIGVIDACWRYRHILAFRARY